MKIGIVNDMPMAAEALRRVVALVPEHQVIWVAHSGAEAVELCARLPPDLVLMDLIMPGMDGVEATRRIMASTPCTILVVTASVDSNAARVFDAMGYGALDAVDTPSIGVDDPSVGGAPLLAKISTIKKLLGPSSSRTQRRTKTSHPPENGSNHALIAIGASAGGPAALAAVLSALPQHLPAAVVVVQHVDERFAPGMAEWLGVHSAWPVRLAKDGDILRPGSILLAGTGDHLALKTPDKLGYTPEPREYPYRPSIDVFFESVSRLWRGKAVGVLLTGMGADGARGLKSMREKGHYTIAQDQASSAVYGMPKAAAAINAAVDILPLSEIAARLIASTPLTPTVQVGAT